MGFFREDFYDECKYYCQVTEFLEEIDRLIDETKYGVDLSEAELLKLKAYFIKTLERMEERRVGWILRD